MGESLLSKARPHIHGALMMLAATILVLAVWLAFIWICDPDGYRETSRRNRRRGHSSSPR
jgi:hypothetical protein